MGCRRNAKENGNSCMTGDYVGNALLIHSFIICSTDIGLMLMAHADHHEHSSCPLIVSPRIPIVNIPPQYLMASYHL